jgi:hypothetical protein
MCYKRLSILGIAERLACEQQRDRPKITQSDIYLQIPAIKIVIAGSLLGLIGTSLSFSDGVYCGALPRRKERYMARR